MKLETNEACLFTAEDKAEEKQFEEVIISDLKR